MILTDNSSLAEAIFSNPSLIPVINRFGVCLGVGDASVSEVCRSHGIDLAFFLAVANTFLNDNYFPTALSGAFPTEKVVEYLSLTDRYYAEVQLPNVERHFGMLLQCSPEGNNLPMLRGFFHEMKRELLSCIDYDCNDAFPAIFNLLKGERGEFLPDTERLERRGVVEKVDDLAAFFVRHLRGSYDRNLCVAVVSAVFLLAKDMRQNNRIRERILVPSVRDLISGLHDEGVEAR